MRDGSSIRENNAMASGNFCTRCGAPRASTGEFCTGCGVRLERGAPPIALMLLVYLVLALLMWGVAIFMIALSGGAGATPAIR